MEIEEIPFTKIQDLDMTTFEWIKQDIIEVKQGISIRVLKITKQKNNEKGKDLVFIPGLASASLGWIALLYELSKTFNIYHIETREKNVDLISKKKWVYSIKELAKDLSKVLDFYNLKIENTFLFGTSVGAEILLEFIKQGGNQPKGLILISPEYDFQFSRWMRIFFRLLPAWLFYPFFPFLKLVLKRFRTNLKYDKKTFYINLRNLKSIKPKILKKCALELFKHRTEVDFSRIECPTFILAASTDKMHSYLQSKIIAKNIPKAIFEDVRYYHRTHKKTTANKIQSFVQKID